MLKEMIIKWNRDRGLLETFDPDLERRMLSEEAREFYMADTFPKKLAEYSDFVFVLEGTKAKYGCNAGTKTESFNSYEEYKELMAWAKNLQDEMFIILDRIRFRANLKNIGDIMTLSLTYVCECNELKGLDKSNGKIVKNADYIDPATLIAKRIGVIHVPF